MGNFRPIAENITLRFIKMKAKLKFKSKEIIINDIRKVSFIGKFTGLMFKPKETCVLLFEFSKGRRTIHSFFCPVFLAIWLLEGKIVDYKLVKPNLVSIRPEKEFDKLIEIPFNKKYSYVVNVFIDEGKV